MNLYVMELIRRNCKLLSRSVPAPSVLCKYCTKVQSASVAAGGEAAGGEAEAEGGSSRWARRVVTGLQPTGELHVGNYFGALRRCVQLQDRGDDLMVFIADLHSLTSYQEPAALRRHTLQLAASALAAGLDPARSVLFVQSAVPRHAELCWLLACLASPARLQQLAAVRGAATLTPPGLLLYPVLQAADVLAYCATHVPVGADQLQHLQLAAQLVKTFHHRYSPHERLFPVPQALLPEDGGERLRSLRNPVKKMSKSDPDPKSRILLTDSDEVITLKIRKAVTDFNPQVSFDPSSRPGVSNLVSLHCLAAGLLPEEAVSQAEGLTTAQYKAVVAGELCAALRPLRERTLQLLERPQHLRDVLRDGAARARARADLTFHRVAAALGLHVGRP